MASNVHRETATLDSPAAVDEQAFFTQADGSATVVDQTDLQQTVQAYDASEIPHLEERARYWLYPPYSFVAIFENTQEDEHRYIVVEPWLDETEAAILEMLKEMVPARINLDSAPLDPSKQRQIRDIRQQARELLQRYRYVERDGGLSWLNRKITRALHSDTGVSDEGDTETLPLSEEQVQKLQYYLVRDFINYGPIDPLRHDVNVEDISCNGPGERIFIDHANYGEIVSNISFEEANLDQFVRNLASRAGKGISKRQPEVDARLPDGSRAKLILGTEINEKGSSFTIRQFKEVPFTPVDLVTWGTFSLDQMAYLWLCIEHGKSGIVAGGTSSGKTTSMNALSLFMPGNQKVVTIEDTPELKLPQANWTPHTTRQAFHGSREDSDYSAYHLLRGALRENPDYLIMGEVRGEEETNEGTTLFQIMSSGHHTYTTFHADNPRELINRFTTEPIGVSPTQFAALDWITVQRQRSMGGDKVRRAVSITEVNEYDNEDEETDVSTVYEWDPGRDMFEQKNSSALLEEIRYENGWREEDLRRELTLRKVVLAYLIHEGINTYAAVAATLQAYMARPEKVLSLIAKNELADHLASIAEKDYINIDIDEDEEAGVPRPSLDDRPGLATYIREFLQRNEYLLSEFTDLETEFGAQAEEGLVVRSPNVERAAGDSSDSPGVGGQVGAYPALEGDSADAAPAEASSTDVDPHLGLAAGEYTIEDGEIRKAVTEAQQEFQGMYENGEGSSDSGPFSNIVEEAQDASPSSEASVDVGDDLSETEEEEIQTVFEQVEEADGDGSAQG